APAVPPETVCLKLSCSALDRPLHFPGKNVVQRIIIRNDLDFSTAFRTEHLIFGNVCSAMCTSHTASSYLRAVSTQLFISIAIVIGPTPPGTGVIAETLGSTSLKSTSPHR